MHANDSDSPLPPTNGKPWWRRPNGYHWFVLIVAALGWLFDTMDQQLFVRVKSPALQELLGATASKEEIESFGGYATTIFILGWATGGLIFGLYGDRWGRAKTMMLTILIYSLFTGLSAFSVYWWDFALYRFLTGMGVGGEFAAGVSLVAEVIPAAARPYALGFLQALSTVGNMTAALVSLAIPPQQSFTLSFLNLSDVAGWRFLFLVGILPAFLVILIRWRLKEPDSWVQAKEAMERGEGQDEMHKQMGDLKELFGDPRWRYHTIIGVLLAMVGVMGLWGVGFFSPELISKNVLADLPAEDQDWYASIGLFLQNLGAFFGIYGFAILTGIVGRRIAFATAYVIGLFAVILVFGYMTTPEQIYWMTPLLGFATLMVFGGFAIYFPELYPTRLRSTGTGFCYNGARYLGALAPLMMGVLINVYSAPDGSPRASEGLSELTVLSSFGIIDSPFRYATLTVSLIYILGLLIIPFMPETKDKPLPE